MITKLNIENYKSIQYLSLSTKRVNILLGKPASGKSNIIEALALLSKRNVSVKELVRMKECNDLIYNRDVERSIKIEIDNASFQMNYTNGKYIAKYYDTKTVDDYKKDYFALKTYRENQISRFSDKTFDQANEILEAMSSQFNEKYGYIKNIIDAEYKASFYFSNNNNDDDSSDISIRYLSNPIYYYKFKVLQDFNNKSTERLNSPYGDNLPQIILTRGKLRKIIAELLEDYDLKLGLNPNDSTIKIIKELDGILIDYPFVSLSDSLQRLIFYITAMYTENSTLLLEEPESHVFPFYNKYMGEKIALDESNQYFVATHNFPFLSSILQKSKPEDLGIYFVCYEEHQTKVHRIPQSKFSDLYDMEDNLFLNLNYFLVSK